MNYNEHAKYSAETIAKWLIAYNYTKIAMEGADSFSNLKLQKMLYYAQGCYLALTDNCLFRENLIAWEHGAVVEEIYFKYAKNGNKGIEYDGDYDISVDSKDIEILIEIYEVFNQYSAWGLRRMIHKEKPYKETVRNDIIRIDLIKDYFKIEYLE